jgi:hypothetical protein
VTGPANKTVMRKPPGFHFWRIAILAGGFFSVVLPFSVAAALLIIGFSIYRETGDFRGIFAPFPFAGIFLFIALIWFCIIDRRMPRMKKTPASSPSSNVGEETKK